MSVALRSWREAKSGSRALDVERRLERAMVERRRLDPRVQIAVLVIMNLLATTPTPTALDVAGVFSAAAILIYCARAAAAVTWLAVYAGIWVGALLCSVSGDPFFASVGAMLMMIRKVYAIAMLATNLIVTVRTGELACALQRMRLPRLIVVALSVALRFFPTLAAEASAVMDAMKLRGVRLSLGNLIRHPLKMLEHFAVPLILRVSVVTDEISRAATVRGIDSRHRRSSLYVLRARAADWFFLLWFAAFAVVSVVLARDGFTFMGLF
ncbi:MAG: energy-coupling factor transporter transmembrane protein EcfT [Coriobacteriales bacterium]|jgi:energy-coupling factor transport system permease protein|nr:energy-coupling factor transporter transmembrane protein EcfT [Coriobacteriales bacterium]